MPAAVTAWVRLMPTAWPSSNASPTPLPAPASSRARWWWPIRLCGGPSEAGARPAQAPGRRIAPDGAGPVPGVLAFERGGGGRQASGTHHRLAGLLGGHVPMHAGRVHHALGIDSAAAGVGQHRLRVDVAARQVCNHRGRGHLGMPGACSGNRPAAPAVWSRVLRWRMVVCGFGVSGRRSRRRWRRSGRWCGRWPPGASPWRAGHRTSRPPSARPARASAAAHRRISRSGAAQVRWCGGSHVWAGSRNQARAT